MIGLKPIAVLAATLLQVGCSNVVTTRNLPLEQIPTSTMPADTGIKSSQSMSWHVKDVRVSVPETLTVSEANLYLPKSDIVWREDPHGDRRAQVATIMEMAASQAVIGLEGSAPVYLDIEVQRFHALSQKARATVGGVHTIFFDIVIRDVATNVALTDPMPIEIRLKAYGGQKAIDAEMRGETQKLRITREIASVTRKYLGI